MPGPVKTSAAPAKKTAFPPERKTARTAGPTAPALSRVTPVDLSAAAASCTCDGGCPRCTSNSNAPLSPEVPPAVGQTLARRGSALQSPWLQHFQSHFKTDFSSVQIHHDANAAHSADAIDASAYSYGAHIVLGSPNNGMNGREKKHLLAHELNHVAESARPVAQMPLHIENDPAAEARANLNASRICQNQSPLVGRIAGPARIRRQPAKAPAASASVKYPATIQVGTESVFVANSAEDKEARQLVSDIQSNYGITLDSGKGKSAVTSQIVGDPDQPKSISQFMADPSAPPQKVKDLITTSTWTLQQLRDLKKGLGYFGKVLGPQRNITNLLQSNAGAQPITSVGRVSTGLNDANTAADPDVYGQFFSSSQHAAFFDSAKASKKLADPKTEFVGIVVHELAHALMPADLFLTGLTPAYWQDAKTRTNDPKAEDAITSYGGMKNASEDMCEAVMFYFVEPATLKTKCPQRYALVEKAVNNLLSPPPPKGPSPVPPNP